MISIIEKICLKFVLWLLRTQGMFLTTNGWNDEIDHVERKTEIHTFWQKVVEIFEICEKHFFVLYIGQILYILRLTLIDIIKES